MPFVLAIPIIAVVMKTHVPVQRAGERGAAMAEPRLHGARLDRLVQRGAVDGDDPDHLAQIALGIILFLARLLSLG